MRRKFLTSLEARTALETPQIVVTWEYDEALFPLIQSVQLRRSDVGWPVEPTDGDAVVTYFAPTISQNSYADLAVEPGKLYYYTLFFQYREANLSRERFRELGRLTGGPPITEHFTQTSGYPGTVVGLAQLTPATVPQSYNGILVIAAVNADGDSALLFWRMDTGFVEYEMDLSEVVPAGDRISSIAWIGRINTEQATGIITTSRRRLIQFRYPHSVSFPTDDPDSGDVIADYDLTEKLGEQVYGTGQKFFDFNIAGSAVEWADVVGPTDLSGDNTVGYTLTPISRYIVPHSIRIREDGGGTLVAVDDGAGGFVGQNGAVVNFGSVEYLGPTRQIVNLKFAVDPGPLEVDFVSPRYGGAVDPRYILLLDSLRNKVYRLQYSDGEYPAIPEELFPFETRLNPDENLSGDNANGYNLILSTPNIRNGSVVIRRLVDDVIVAIDTGIGRFAGRNGWPVWSGTITYEGGAAVTDLRFSQDGIDFVSYDPGPLSVEYAIGTFTEITQIWDGSNLRNGVAFTQEIEGRDVTEIDEYLWCNDDPYETPGSLLRTYVDEPIIGLFFRNSNAVYDLFTIGAQGNLGFWWPRIASANNYYTSWFDHRVHAYSGRAYPQEFSFRDNLYGWLSESMRSQDHTPLDLPSATIEDGEVVRRDFAGAYKQIERLYRLVGLFLDRTVDLRLFFQNHLDPRRCDPRWLTSLAYRSGVGDLGVDWPLDRQRIYMELRPLINQRKGTLRAIEQLVKFYGFELGTATTQIILGRQFFDSWDSINPVPFDSGSTFDTFGELFEVLLQIRLRRISDLEELPGADPMAEFLVNKINKIIPFNVTLEYV